MTKVVGEGTIYTALTEGYDHIRPLHVEPHVLHDVRMAPHEIKSGRDGTLWNREQKLVNPPKTGLWSVYLDASFSPKGPVRESVEKWLDKADVALFKHPWRTCAYDEIDECVKRSKITALEGEKARSMLQLAGFPRHFGLWALGMIVRRVYSNSLQIFAMPMVWDYVQQLPRDQIWFPFVIYRLRQSLARIHTIDKDIYSNKLLSFRKHGS